jgi:hypothetical protein
MRKAWPTCMQEHLAKVAKDKGSKTKTTVSGEGRSDI